MNQSARGMRIITFVKVHGKSRVPRLLGLIGLTVKVTGCVELVFGVVPAKVDEKFSLW